MMRFSLKNYQMEASDSIVETIGEAYDDYSRKKKLAFVGLSACTGAGKTVIASSVLENILCDGLDEENDSFIANAVVLWVTNDPALNAQTYDRIIKASDGLKESDLKIIKDGFCEEKFDAGKIYFLNTQKLSKTSNLTKHNEGQLYTLWDTIRNTVEDEDLFLILILDEAHHGMKMDDGESQTISKMLVNGRNADDANDAVPAVPFVLGISATLQRFQDSMSSNMNRIQYPMVNVSTSDVRTSGLIKDRIQIFYPERREIVEESMLREAVNETYHITARWEKEHDKDKTVKLIQPLLLIQVPNKISDEELFELGDIVVEQWNSNPPLKYSPQLIFEDIGHVLGNHSDIADPTQRRTSLIPYYKPEKIENLGSVRVIFAKEAVTTGWDCPRCEVFISFRSAKDKTYITQLLGRVIRNPLAKNIPGNDALNTVSCYLPNFNKETVEEVVMSLTGDSTDDGSASGFDKNKVSANKVLDYEKNPNIEDNVWDCFKSLEVDRLPDKPLNNITRAYKLVALLANHGIKEYDNLKQLLFKAAAEASEVYKDDIDEVFKALNTFSLSSQLYRNDGDFFSAQGETLNIDVKSSFDTLQGQFNKCKRKLYGFRDDLYLYYINNSDEEKTATYKKKICALSEVPEVVKYIEKKSGEFVDYCLNKHDDFISKLANFQREDFNAIKQSSNEISRALINVPENSKVFYTNDNDIDLYRNHLMADNCGEYMCDLNKLEDFVVNRETYCQGTVAWYRNPSGKTDDSFSIKYDCNGEYKLLKPDFLFFHEDTDGSIKPYIVDPHGAHLSDYKRKLRGMAEFAAEYGDKYHRIESVTDYVRDGKKRIVFFDLKDEGVREILLGSDYEEVEDILDPDLGITKIYK